jgi:hypothetical protein
MKLVVPATSLLLLACGHTRPPITMADKEAAARPLQLDGGEWGSTGSRHLNSVATWLP